MAIVQIRHMQIAVISSTIKMASTTGFTGFEGIPKKRCHITAYSF